jgi:hypothetical protein
MKRIGRYLGEGLLVPRWWLYAITFIVSLQLGWWLRR